MAGELTALERRLDVLSAGAALESDGDYIDALTRLIDAEAAKDAEAIDAAVVGDALDALLCFAGENADAIAKHAAENVREFIETDRSLTDANASTKRRVSRKTVAALAAAAVIASLAAAAFGGGFGVLDMTKREWSELTPETKFVAGSLEISKSVESREYDDLATLIAAEDIGNVKAPAGFMSSAARMIVFADRRVILANLFVPTGASADLEIDVPAPYGKLENTVKLAGFDVVVSEYDGVWQGEWIKDGAWYCLKTNGEDALRAFIAAFSNN